jgi:hypothetical protein
MRIIPVAHVKIRKKPQSMAYGGYNFSTCSAGRFKY